MSADPIAAEARAMGYVVHRADKVASNGAMSALCSDPPTPIDVRPGSRITWTIADAETNCPACLARIGARLLRQLRAEQEAPRPASIGADGRALTQPTSDRRAVRVSARLQAEVCELAGIANFHAALERLVAILRARVAK